MKKNKIGLKLADGEFYPVLEDGVASRKRLVVTTVQDAQPSVQIDLYRGSGGTVDGASYIGSLVVEGIPKMPKGDPDIRMDLGLAADGTLTAFAQEASTGSSQSLKVSLESLSEEEKYEIPDFEVDKETEATASFSDADFEETDSLPSGADSAQLLHDVHSEVEAAEAAERPERTGLKVALIVAAALIVLGGLAFLAWKFLLPPAQAAKAEPAASVAVQSAPAQSAPEPAPAAQAAQAPKPAPAEAPAPAAEPAKVEPAPPPAPDISKKETTFREPGVTYKIKWGDTLWDLSYAFYRDPWVFMRIAKANKIKNPDLIISGERLWIPPVPKK